MLRFPGNLAAMREPFSSRSAERSMGFYIWCARVSGVADEPWFLTSGGFVIKGARLWFQSSCPVGGTKVCTVCICAGT